MSSDPFVIQLVTDVLDSDRTPEDVCSQHPDLLEEVCRRVDRCRELNSRLDRLFFSPNPEGDGKGFPGAAPLPQIPLYQVLAIIGEGGMGVVYSAHHLKLKRVVALKMLRSGAYASPAELGRFTLEAEAIAGLQHPNIVQIHDLGEIEGRPYFTMEYLEGGSLHEKLDGAPLPPAEAARYLVTMATAVSAAHRAGIVHRDLKPANVLFSSEGQLKISDFGLARRVTAKDDLTFCGARMGTPSYMAPEQAAGQTAAVGKSTDIYALGAILYEMLTEMSSQRSRPTLCNGSGFGRRCRSLSARRADPRAPGRCDRARHQVDAPATGANNFLRRQFDSYHWSERRHVVVSFGPVGQDASCDRRLKPSGGLRTPWTVGPVPRRTPTGEL
jgi:serine/threonine-protein kinase